MNVTSLFQKERSKCRVVGVTGFEPVTSSLSVKCSNQLSYTPVNQKYTYPFIRLRLTLK